MPKMRKSRKAIHFDLYTNKIATIPGFEGVSGRLKAYGAIYRAMNELGFKHQQGSGYHSADPLGDPDILRIVSALDEKLPWFSSCMKKVNVMDVPDALYDLRDLFLEATRDRVGRASPDKSPEKIDPTPNGPQFVSPKTQAYKNRPEHVQHKKHEPECLIRPHSGGNRMVSGQRIR